VLAVVNHRDARAVASFSCRTGQEVVSGCGGGGYRLDDAEGARLQAIFVARAELARAWSMLGALRPLPGRRPDHGRGAPPSVRSHLEADPLPELDRVASDIIRWAPEIFNFHRAGRWSDSPFKGTNNLLGVLNGWRSGSSTTPTSKPGGSLLIHGPGPWNRAVS